MPEERHIDPDELRELTSDPEQARRLHKALRTLSSAPGVDGRLKDMSRQVLRGDMGIKEAVSTESYTEAIYSRLGEMRRAAENQTYAERQASKAAFASWNEKREAEEDRERAERDAPVHLRTKPQQPSGPSPFRRR